MTNIDFRSKLSSAKDIFSDSFKKTIDKTKTLFKESTEYIDAAMVKCCVVGNTTTGKSTLINALLKNDILYEGITLGTLCAARCLASQNEEYFQIYEGYECLEKSLPIQQVKDINRTNLNYSKFSMNTNNYLSIYLKPSNYEILQNFILIDCPGFDDDNFDAISKYCKYADIIIFCFRAKEGVTKKELEKINKIKENIGNFQINFLINRCDEVESFDKMKIIADLYSLLTEQEAIFFISAIEERKGTLNDDRHREFERFKQCLLKQKSQAKITYRKVYLELISSVNCLLNDLNSKNSRNCKLSDETFMQLQKQIVKEIYENKSKFTKEDISRAFLEYSNQANKEISNFLVKQFTIDFDLKKGIINENYFYKRFIGNDSIPKPTFGQHEYFDKSSKLKTSFVDYFTENSTKIKENIDKYYKERAKSCIEELENYKTELKTITQKINDLVMD